jgi:hypothetical protein
MREVIGELLHKGNFKFWPEPPTEDKLENYATFGDLEDGPTFEYFCLDFSHTPLHKSVWNRHAADIFVEQCCCTYDTKMLPEVKEEFLGCLG